MLPRKAQRSGRDRATLEAAADEVILDVAEATRPPLDPLVDALTRALERRAGWASAANRG